MTESGWSRPQGKKEKSSFLLSLVLTIELQNWKSLIIELSK
jgi:hypothetical protein